MDIIHQEAFCLQGKYSVITEVTCLQIRYESVHKNQGQNLDIAMLIV